MRRYHPIHKGKCPPVIENSDEMLREICYSKAHEIYGEELPKVVEERLERELNSIISNGYAVMYMIAQKLVWKSNSRRLSGRVPWFRRFLLCSHHVRYHRGKSS